MVQEIKNLREAAKIIKKAVSDKENIIVYGDADLDGVAAAIMTGEIVKNVGGVVNQYYFPEREREGYGITKTALAKLAGLAPGLIIAVDLGIGNFEEVEIAKKAGFKIAIIDHHEILDGIPKAEVVVDPKQAGDEYPFKFFCAAGLVFKLAEVVFGHLFRGNLRQSFVELAALATLADMMPREEDNKDIIEEGMMLVKDSFRPGIRAFFETDAYFENDSRNFNQRISRIIVVLNVRDFRNGLPATFELLTVDSLEMAHKLIREFLAINALRRNKIDAVVDEIDKIIANENEPIFFGGSPNWESSLLGAIASIINNKYKKPVFIYKKLETESLGTVRSTDQVDSVALMKKCKDLLITFGGHPKASGFRLKNENVEKFKECLIKNISG